jgi:hypothetical protein
LTLLVVAALYTSTPAPAPAVDEAAAPATTPVVQVNEPVTLEEVVPPPCETPTKVAVEVAPEATPIDPAFVATEAAPFDPDRTPCPDSTSETVTSMATALPADSTPTAAATSEPSPSPAEASPESNPATEVAIAGPVTPESDVAPAPDQPMDGSAIVVPEPTPGGESLLNGPATDAASPLGTEIETSTGDESSSAEEPTASQTATAEDPMLTGMARAGDPTPDGTAPAEDPMVAGLAPEPTVEAIVIEQQPDMFVAAAPAANAKKPKAGVTADTLSPDGSVVPGGQAFYYFRVVNTARNTEHFWIEAETAGAGWTTAVYSEDGSVPLTARQTLKGGEAMTILIVVTAPTTALAGEVAVTTVNAIDNN